MENLYIKVLGGDYETDTNFFLVYVNEACVLETCKPKINYLPYFNATGNKLISVNDTDLKDKLEFRYQSIRANDTEGDKIQLEVRDLSKIPCECVKYSDNGDGTFKLYADVSKL